MAKITEEASATVSMNMEPARKEFDEWTQKVEEGKRKLEELLAVPEKKRDNKAIKAIEADIAQAEKRVKSAEEKLHTFRDTLKNLDSASMNQLYKASKQLEAQLKRLKPGTEEFIAASKDLKAVNTRIKSIRDSWKAVNEEQKQSTLSLKGLADGFNRYFGMATTAIASITGISMAFRKCAEEAAQLDDIYADVMKTTGLLHDEVAALDEELMKIDTRTSREQLLLLARDAGKLGIQGKENILGFVRAANQIQVALGEDLGEGAIRNLGKIADVLGYTDSMGIEKALLSIGSAVNAVGQASTASEAYLVDFTQRLAGVAAQAHISAADIIGFASGLDQSAMKVEMAATAFQKFLMKMYEEPAKFAAYANMQVKEFTDLLNNDANTAITTVLKALKDQDGFAAMVPIFNDMGLDGARAVSVLASMASNLDAVTEAQALANVEFAKATSVTNEYATKNNNLRAELEKARKELHNKSIELGQKLSPALLKSTKGVTYLIKALANYGKEIKTVLIVIAALTAAFKIHVIWQKLVATWNGILKAGSLLLQGAIALLTGNVKAATAAWGAMSAVMKTTVFGLIVAAVSAVVIALERMIKKQKEARAEAQYMEDINKRINQEYSEQAGEINALSNIIHNNNLALDQRKRALEKLKQIVPDYHADLTKEGELINDNTDALGRYLENLEKVTRSKILEDEFTKATAEVMNWEQTLKDANEAADQALRDANGNAALTYQRTATMMFDQQQWEQTLTYQTEYGKRMDKVTEATMELNKALEKQAAIRERIETNEYVADDGGSSGGNGGGGGGGGAGMDPKEAKKLFDERIRVIQDGYKLEEKQLTLSLKRKKISEAEYEAEIIALKGRYFQEKFAAAQQYGQDETAIWSEYYDWQIKLIEKHEKEVAEIEEAMANVRRARRKKELEEERKRLEAEAKIRENEQKILAQNLADAKSRIADENWKEEYDFEKWKLDQLHSLGMLSERDYQKSLLALRLEYAAKGAERLNQIASASSDFVSALKDAEAAKLDAQYQADLTAAGDNAEKKEEIEKEYEQKKLDLQKKYADTEMVINIAKTIAAGALAAIQAFAQLGPIAGGIMAAIIAATTAAEVYTIVQQRNAIKNSSVSSSSSGNTSTVTSGNRTMTGYAEGGYTENHTTVTTVGEKGREWVAPAWMVRKNPVTFANLEQYRKAGSHGRSGSVSRGFADGGYTEEAGKAVAPSNQPQLLTEATGLKILAACERDTKAWVALNEIEATQKRKNKFKSQTSR